MTDRPADRRTRQWTSQPAHAMPYRLADRLGDWWCATRDARTDAVDLLVPVARAAGTPRIDLGTEREPVPDTTAVWATPRTVFLGQLGRGRSEREWVQYEADVADQLIGLRQARQKRESAQRRLASAEQRLAGLAPPTGAELAMRKTGEERTDAAVVAERRRREYLRRREPAEAEVERLRAAVEAQEVELARLAESVRIRFEVAQTRSAMIDAYIRRRCAAYVSRLVRKHPDGSRIGPLVRSGWPDLRTARELSSEVAELTVGDGHPAAAGGA